MGSVLLLGAMLWPAFGPPEADSLPLSNYPMFARDRERVSSFHAVVLVTDDGTERLLRPSEVGGTDQPVQAARTVQQAIGRDEAAELCAEIAAGLDGTTRLEVVTRRYDAVAWFRDDHRVVDELVHATCLSGAAG